MARQRRRGRADSTASDDSAAGAAATNGAGAGAGAGASDAAGVKSTVRSAPIVVDTHCKLSLIVLAVVGVAIAALLRQARLDASVLPVLGELTGGAFTGGLAAACIVLCCIGIQFAGRKRRLPSGDKMEVTAVEEYETCGVGSTAGLDSSDLYLDMVKRGVANVLYQDTPRWFYGSDKTPRWAARFILSKRRHGDDVPSQAHSMVGLKRLDNIVELVKRIKRDNVPGDFVETGVLKGGSVVLMRACLRALEMEGEGRRVIACDTFRKQKPPPPLLVQWALFPIVRAFASIPNRWWHRWFFMLAQRTQAMNEMMFPYMSNPSDDTVECGIFFAQHVSEVAHAQISATVDQVKDVFARYGLLDDSVVFLKGFFSETLPSDIKQCALIRLDGDTYESTMTALAPLYPLLAVGGYVIVDDYNSFNECSRAIDEYREKHGITDEIHSIDNHAVWWQKTKA